MSASFGGAINRAVGPASNPFPSGLLPSGLGMAKPTIPQARDQAEVLWGRCTPGMGHERRFPGTSGNGRPKRARECLLKVGLKQTRRGNGGTPDSDPDRPFPHKCQSGLLDSGCFC